MQKIIITIIYLLFFNLVSAQIQSGEVIYKVKLSEEEAKVADSIEGLDDNTKRYLEKEFSRLNRTLPHLSYTLEFNSKESLFTNPETMGNDSGLDLNEGYGYTNVFGNYYTNLEEEINLRQFKEFDKMILLQTELDSLDWEVVDGEKTIQGYVCKKAKATLNLNGVKSGEITAWFTPEIPFQFGPADIAGLPGLILGFERQDKFFFYADDIQLNEEPTTIKRPKKGELINLEQREKMTRKMLENYKSSY